MTSGVEAKAPATGAVSASDRALAADPRFLESRGWTSSGDECAPKRIAILSLASLPASEPLPSVSYHSRGNLLIVAAEAPERARQAAEQLAGDLHVTLLVSAHAPQATGYAVWSGRLEALDGYLGEFTVTVAGLRMSDAAPSAGPIPAKFDLVLDFSRASLFTMRQPPQGYFAAPQDDDALAQVLQELRESVGEFEKPRFFNYRENLCAHSRSQVEGCNACIEVCSTGAISSDGDRVKVDPHLCMGCGTCATVCPSGAMGYQFPRLADRGAQVKQLLAAYREAGGADPAIVFHNGHDGRGLLERAAAAGRGLPPHVLPLEAWHVSSIGLDVLLPAIAFGARQVLILSAGSEDAEENAALRAQMAIGEAIVQALGYGGRHFELVEAGDPEALHGALAALGSAQGVSLPATFLVSNDKRTAVEFALEHLAKLAPRPVAEIALPAGAPYGEVKVDRQKCTMCLACVGSCPESALMDGVDVPLLKFLERNCVQCGLCEATCPEDAITLSPRLLLTPAVREARVLNETQPFHCIRCSKPFGTRQMVDAMMGRLAAHSMFTQGGALRRLQMCADCRVVDMMAAKDEVSVLRLGADS